MTKTPLPILYSFRRCPYAMRARLAIASAGIAVELREVVLRDKPKEMIEASAKATVPVLVLPDGSVLDESRDIAVWALEQNDPEGWLEHDRKAIDDLIDVNDGTFKRALDRYKYPNRYPEEAIDPYQQRDTAAQVIAGYESRLAGQKWLLGDRVSWADMAVLPFVRQLAHVDRDWFWSQPWPHVIVWLDSFLASQRFAAIMEKYPAWKNEDASTLFGQAHERQAKSATL